MAAYKDLIGQKITVVTSNPPEPKTGQMWYNSTDGKLRGLGVTSAWRSSSPLIVARDAAGSAGTQSTATIFGGNINPGNTSATDEYNGSGFSSGGTLGTARRQTSGCGLQTAALCVAGYTTANAANVEEYNGTSWSEQNDIPSNYRNGSTFGTQTAALYVGGYSAPVPNATTIQIYDGTNWTTSPATLGTGGNSISSTGTSTAGLVFGGSNRLNVTEEWNGSAMSTGGNLTTSKYGRGSANQAPSENAMSAGGGIPAQTTVENYNGTSWSTLPSLAVATNSIKGAGTVASAIMMGGGPGAGPVFNTTTEFDQTTNTITAAAWASGGALPVAVYDGAGAGTQTAGLAFGGDTAPDGTAAGSYEYNGTSWTAGNSLNNGRRELNGFGTQTAGVATLGGDTPATTYTEEYDGTNWSNANAASTARTMMGAAGVQTSGLVCGGNPGTMTTTEEYDGTNWSSGGALPVGKQSNDCFGNIVTAIRNVGGNTSPANYVSTTESYDGTNWTSGPTMLYGADRLAASGSSTSGLVCGGRESGTKTTKCANFDGTTYATNAVLSNARSGQMATGKGETSNASSFLAGGYNPSNARMTATEEFTGETLTANVTDFSTE